MKGKFLEEAAKHFARNGFEASNINEIALGAGYAKGTIYNYFRSKEELFGEVISMAAKRTVERFRSAPVHQSVRNSLQELAQADVSVLREEESFMKVLASEAMNPISENYDLIITHLGEFTLVISGLIERGIENGEIRSDKPAAQLALVFLGLLTLLYVQRWKSARMWPSLEEIPDLVVTLFLDGAGRMEPGLVSKKRR